jgi:hemerythrin-like domain-containing protein
MNALNYIKNEHDMFKRMLKQLDETTERAEKTREELFTKLKTELVSHEEMEEQVFYPALKEQSKKAKDIVNEGIQEHHVADVLVEELSSLPVSDEEWSAKVSVLKESIEHHIEEEEGEMFGYARKAFSEEELDELGQRMREVKESTKKRLSQAA